jgi:hypothetical protein
VNNKFVPPKNLSYNKKLFKLPTKRGIFNKDSSPTGDLDIVQGKPVVVVQKKDTANSLKIKKNYNIKMDKFEAHIKRNSPN